MASCNLVLVEWVTPKRYCGFRERISKSRIRGKIVTGEEVRATWRGKLYRVKIVDENGYEWEEDDDEPLVLVKPSAVSPTTSPSPPEPETQLQVTSPLPQLAQSLPPGSLPQPAHPLTPPTLPSPVLAQPFTPPPLPLPQPVQLLTTPPQSSPPPQPSPQQSQPESPIPPPVSPLPPPMSPLSQQTPPVQPSAVPSRFHLPSLSQQPISHAPPPPDVATMEYVKRLEDRIKHLESIVLGNNSTKGEKPKYRLVNGQAVLGYEGGAQVSTSPALYDRLWEKSFSGRELVLKLMSLVLTEDLMASSNFFGGPVFTGKEWVRKLELRTYPPFQAIVSQAEIEFPGCFATESGKKSLRDMVNSKCRKICTKRKNSGLYCL